MIPDLIVDMLAAYRLTRLVTKDTILRTPRAAVIRAAYQSASADGDFGGEMTDVEWEQTAIGDDDAPKLAELVICRYCVGMYVGFGVIAARRYAPRQWAPVARALACASAAALIARLEQ